MDRLRTLPLFRDLNDETFAELTAIARHRIFKKGEILFYEGDDAKDLTVLIRGVLKLFKTSSSDKEVILHYFTPVTLVAEVAVLHRIPYPATAVFETDGEVLLIDYAAFESLFLNDPELVRILLLSLSMKIRTLEAVIERGLVMDASERVLNLLKTSPELFESMRHYEIANILNLTPETFSRTLAKLRSDGKVVKRGTLWTVRHA